MFISISLWLSNNHANCFRYVDKLNIDCLIATRTRISYVAFYFMFIWLCLSAEMYFAIGLFNSPCFLFTYVPSNRFCIILDFRSIVSDVSYSRWPQAAILNLCTSQSDTFVFLKGIDTKYWEIKCFRLRKNAHGGVAWFQITLMHLAASGC